MSKRSPRLQFTEDELSAPKVAKAAGKAEKRVDKLEKAEQKIPKKVVKRKMHTVDPASGAVTTRILFEETDMSAIPRCCTAATPSNTAISHLPTGSSTFINSADCRHLKEEL